MKGLIYKDLLLSKKNYLSFLFLTVLVVSLGILIGLGTRFGNIQDYSVEEKGDIFYIFCYAVYAMEIAMLMEVFGFIERDRANGWRKIEYTMPLSAKRRIGAWYLLGGMIMGIGFCAGLLNSVVMALAFGQSITGAMFKDMLLILLGGVLILLIGIPIYQRFSAKSIERFWNVLFVVGVLAFFLGFVIMLLIVKDLEQMRVLFNNFSRVICSFLKQILDFAPFMLPLLPLLMVGSFTLSVRWYQRREV